MDSKVVSEIAIILDWVPLTTKGGQRYNYPTDRSTLPAKEYRFPDVYRWSLLHPSNQSEFLVGETENLYVRLGQYLKHNRPHHVRVRNRFDEIVNSGGEVKLEVLKFDPFVVNGVKFAPDRLNNLFVRRLLENLCCAQLEGDGHRLLNETSAKRSDKKRNRKLEKLAQKMIKAGVKPEDLQKVVRQGTASAVPKKQGEEGGFSR